jgi:predicted small secreted protein
MTRSRSLHTALIVAFVISLGLGASACNTVEGIGKDVSSLGRAMGADGDKRN